MEDVVSEANVLDRGRKGEDDWAGEEGSGDAGEANGNAALDGERAVETSDAGEDDLSGAGTASFCKFWLDVCGDAGDGVPSISS